MEIARRPGFMKAGAERLVAIGAASLLHVLLLGALLQAFEVRRLRHVDLGSSIKSFNLARDETEEPAVSKAGAGDPPLRPPARSVEPPPPATEKPSDIASGAVASSQLPPLGAGTNTDTSPSRQAGIRSEAEPTAIEAVPQKPPEDKIRALYAQRLWRHIAARRPSGTHIPGTAIVTFAMTSDGSLKALSLARSSGNAMLDRLALRTVRAAAPFPVPPPELQGADMAFSLPFGFR
jgi:protein TonB